MESGLNTISEELSAKLFEMTSTFTHPMNHMGGGMHPMAHMGLGMMHPGLGGMNPLMHTGFGSAVFDTGYNHNPTYYY